MFSNLKAIEKSLKSLSSLFGYSIFLILVESDFVEVIICLPYEIDNDISELKKS